MSYVPPVRQSTSVDPASSYGSTKDLVKWNMLAMDRKSFAYGVDDLSYHQMHMMASWRCKNKPLTIKQRLRITGIWDCFAKSKKL